jgi:hypothetical protein
MLAFDAAGLIESVKNAAGVVAVVVGGWWTYSLFIKGRGDFPRASITHRIAHRRLTGNQTLVRVTVGFENSGTVLLTVGEGVVRLSQVDPLPNDGVAPRQSSRTVEWPEIESRGLEANVVEVEPGESDEVDFDFVLDAEIDMVEVYSYFRNPSKADRDIGWTLTTLYELKDEVREVERTVERLSGRSRNVK